MPTLVITPTPTPVGYTAKTAEIQHVQSHSESVLVADFGSIPPEINSARMYTGAGAAPLLTAAATWDALAADLDAAAGSHHAVASQLTAESWLGHASTAMMGATARYLAWLHDTAALATRTAQHARAAVAAYEAARAMTVPPSIVAANRAQLAALSVADALGLHAHTIAANEVQYREMWAQDSTAMYMYADTSATASNVTPFLPPPGITGETAAPRLAMSSTLLRGLRRLASPARVGSATGTVGCAAMTVDMGKAASVGALSAPRSWFTAAASGEPAVGAWGAAPISATPAVPMMPVTRTARREAGGHVPLSRPGRCTIVGMRSSG